MSARRSVIVGTGSYIPAEVVRNDTFLQHRFRDEHGAAYTKANQEMLSLFEKITGISERRYASANHVASDMACLAAQRALESAGLDGEALDYIIVAHNFGDARPDGPLVDLVPSLASRVKQRLGIQNPDSVAYDIIFGCPGWLQAVIQADYYVRSGDAKRALVIGVYTLSRVLDPHDRDSMIYADGAGAVVLEAVPSERNIGVLCHIARTDAAKHAQLLRMGKSNGPDGRSDRAYLKMDGRALYEYALDIVPKAIKACMDKAGLTWTDIQKFLLHQANAKMDEAILKRLGHLCGVEVVASSLMPMTISWLGNSSVATLPTLLDLLINGQLKTHRWQTGGTYLFASVGAGMNVNALAYRSP